ncbi:hypothetical protein [Cysteiniphilum sp. 6C5]|uniref:hypothetical protein n=1 Tax=unclassified Cysteiniphilum TaxID=2610889 RepID=UPI003F82CF75
MFTFKRTRKLVRSAFMVDAIKQQHSVLKDILKAPFKTIAKINQPSADAQKVDQTLADDTLYHQCLTALKCRLYFFLILFIFGTGYFLYLLVESHAIWQSALMMLMINVILFLYVFRYHMWSTQAKHKLKQLSLAGYFQLLRGNSSINNHQHDKNCADNRKNDKNQQS